MKVRRLLGACLAAMSLTFVPSIRALQTSDAAGTAAKAKKKAKEAAGASVQATEAKETAKGAATSPARVVSDSEIAAAKASGKVWVNTETGVYHKGGKWYGATKQGKFMTEDEAAKAGYRAVKTK